MLLEHKVYKLFFFSGVSSTTFTERKAAEPKQVGMRLNAQKRTLNLRTLRARSSLPPPCAKQP